MSSDSTFHLDSRKCTVKVTNVPTSEYFMKYFELEVLVVDIAVSFSVNFLSHWDQLNAKSVLVNISGCSSPNTNIKSFELGTYCEDSSKAAKA